MFKILFPDSILSLSIDRLSVAKSSFCESANFNFQVYTGAKLSESVFGFCQADSAFRMGRNQRWIGSTYPEVKVFSVAVFQDVVVN
jgi:hypothetical protein